MTSSPSRVVYTLYGPKVVNSSEPPQQNDPLPGAPIIRFCSSPSPSRWSPEPYTPPVAPIKRSGSGRRTSRTTPTSPYARPPHAYPNQASSLPPPPHSAPPSARTVWENTMHTWEERMYREISGISIATTNYLNSVERDRDGYKVRAEKAEGQLHVMGKMLSSLALRDANRPFPGPPTPENELMQKFSSVGPLRRNPTPSNSSRFQWTSSIFGLPRCKSADPCLPSRTNDDCFDVTIVDYPMPPQSRSARKPSNTELIRDASRSNESPRPSRAPYGPGELDIQHIDILYIPLSGRLFCQACHVNKEKSQDLEAEVKNFSNNASWDDLREHCITEHPSECQEVVKLTHAQMNELRRRLRARQSSA